MKKVPTEHYRKHPSGIECIQVTRHMGFNVGNAIKYLWRADHKENAVQDLRKAAWYVLDQLYSITGDSFYLNKRDELENYQVSVEPLIGWHDVKELYEEDEKQEEQGPKRSSHDTKSNIVTKRENEILLNNTPVTC